MSALTPYVIAGLFLIIIISFAIRSLESREKRNIFKNGTYRYEAKPSLMTKSEADFFNTLDNAVKQKYYVFPQVHLSAIFDHHVKGQDWSPAFKHINGKSVDYVLCDRATLRPSYGIELDDYTHDKVDRRERDAEVERIFEIAAIPLVRFKNRNVTEAAIIHALANTHGAAR